MQDMQDMVLTLKKEEECFWPLCRSQVSLRSETYGSKSKQGRLRGRQVLGTFLFFCRLSFGYVNHPGGNPSVFCIRYRSQKTVSKSPPLMFCKLQILRGILFPKHVFVFELLRAIISLLPTTGFERCWNGQGREYCKR